MSRLSTNTPWSYHITPSSTINTTYCVYKLTLRCPVHRSSSPGFPYPDAKKRSPIIRLQSHSVPAPHLSSNAPYSCDRIRGHLPRSFQISPHALFRGAQLLQEMHFLPQYSSIHTLPFVILQITHMKNG